MSNPDARKYQDGETVAYTGDPRHPTGTVNREVTDSDRSMGERFYYIDFEDRLEPMLLAEGVLRGADSQSPVSRAM